jgi:hypothetical protein
LGVARNNRLPASSWSLRAYFSPFWIGKDNVTSITREVGDTTAEVVLECLFELPGAVLSECNHVESFLSLAIFGLVICAFLMVFLGLVSVVAEDIFGGGLQQLGLK